MTSSASRMTSRTSRPRMLASALLLWLLGVANIASAAGDVAGLVAPLQAARERGALGSVGGRAYAEGRQGGAEATPYASVSVLLLPRSREFEAEGLLSVCVQHEMDHLVGKVFVEYLSALKRDRIKTKMLKKTRDEQRV